MTHPPTRSGRRSAVTLALALALALLTPPASASAHPTTESNAVVVWNRVTDDVAVTACLAPGANPLDESRLNAMVHLAIHDAVNAITPRFAGYAYVGQSPGASIPAAVASAASTVLSSVLQSRRATAPPGCTDRGLAVVRERYHSALASIPNGTAERDGIDVGRDAALAIVVARARDGSHPAGGSFRAWARVTPFVLPDLEDRAERDPGPTSPAYAPAVAELQRLGGDGFVTASQRTPAETEIALFWRQSPVLSWNAVARSVATGHQLDVVTSAHLFAVLNLALADSYVATAAVLVRRSPAYAVIRTAEDDGNPETHGDPRWTPLAGADPRATHELAQTAVAAAAAAALADVVGTDQVTFTLCSRTAATGTCQQPQPGWRSYGSFSQAAAEIGRAQVLLGRQLGLTIEPDRRRGARLGHLIGTTWGVLGTLAPVEPCYPERPWSVATQRC